MLDRGPHSKSYLFTQSYLLLTLVVSIILQVVTFIVDIGVSLSLINNDWNAWHVLYLSATIVLFLVGFFLRVIGIQGTTNEKRSYIVSFATGIPVIYILQIIIHVNFHGHRLVLLISTNVFINLIAFALAALFARHLRMGKRDEPLNDPLSAFH